MGDKVAGHPELSFGAVDQDSGEQVPKVTVTRTPGTDSMAYQIAVDSNQPISIGNTPIVFATVQNKPGILPNPASNIKTYRDDMQSVSQVAGQAPIRVSFGGGYIASNTYKGPQLANQQMQDFMNHHLAAYVTIHDDANNSNNNGHTGNVPLLSPDPLADAGPIKFGFGIAEQNTVNGKAQQNVSDGSAIQTGTVPANESKTVTETIRYQYANGSQAAPDHAQTVTFSRQGTRQLLGNT